jgi:tetratricopeptide (TPR) repeat protein
LLVVAAAVLLHLPAHFAPWSTTSRREALPEDHPAFVGNAALQRAEGEGLFAAVSRAAHDRESAWLDAGDTVGRARWRPVTTALFVAERAAPWSREPDGAAAGAALVSLALHVLVALGAARLAASLGGDARAATVAGLLAAASPVALSAAAWPARQAVVLAAALALAGTLVALRGGFLRMFAGGVLLALAGLAHEAAFGWAFAVPLLRRVAVPRARWTESLPCVVAPVFAFAARWHFLDGLGIAGDGATISGAVDGAVGVVASFLNFALPARTHFADGPFSFGPVGRFVGVVALVVLVAFLARRAARPAAAAALAATIALAPLVVSGSGGGAPFQDAGVYLALPCLAAAAGLLFADFAATAGVARTASVAAAAALLAASVAATSTRAASFRTKSGLVELATSESPRSLVVRTWNVASRAGVDQHAVADEVARLASDAAADAPRLRGDAVAAATVSGFFVNYARAVNASSLPLHDRAYDAAEAAAAAAAEIRPQSWRAWLVLATLRNKTGALRGAFDAASRAMKLAPDNAGVLRTTAEISLAAGDARFAADTMERAMALLRADRSYVVDDDDLTAYARTLAADGAWRVPDVLADYGFRYRYDVAAEVLDGLMRKTPQPPGVRVLLYDVYLRYGDTLATLDRTAMALIAYDKGVELTGGDEKQAAAQHRSWLIERLDKEAKAAQKRFDEAVASPDKSDLANAFADMYVVLCRMNRTAEADALFAKIEQDLAGVVPAMRFHRAVQRFAAREDPDDQQRAERELRQVLHDDPSLARARFELGRVLEWLGTKEKLKEAQSQFAQAAREGAAEDWSLDAAERAEAIDAFLRSEAESSR